MELGWGKNSEKIFFRFFSKIFFFRNFFKIFSQTRPPHKITTQDQSTNTYNHPIPTQKSSLKTTHIEQHTQRERSESAQEDMKTHDLGSISDSFSGGVMGEQEPIVFIDLTL